MGRGLRDPGENSRAGGTAVTKALRWELTGPARRSVWLEGETDEMKSESQEGVETEATAQ